MIKPNSINSNYSSGLSAFWLQPGAVGGSNPVKQKPSGNNGQVRFGELTRAKQVNNGGYHNPITGGDDGDKLDVNNNDLFKTSAEKGTTKAINAGGDKWANAAKGLGDMFSDASIAVMEQYNKLFEEQGKAANSVTGFQG